MPEFPTRNSQQGVNDPLTVPPNLHRSTIRSMIRSEFLLPGQSIDEISAASPGRIRF